MFKEMFAEIKSSGFVQAGETGFSCNPIEMLDMQPYPCLGAMVFNTKTSQAFLGKNLWINFGQPELKTFDLRNHLPEISNGNSSINFKTILKNPGEKWETVVIGKDGNRIPVHVFQTEGIDKTTNFAVLVINNITEVAIDSLTGLLNRRHVVHNLTDNLNEALRYGYPLSLAMMDIDYFKQYNDKCFGGHSDGDKILSFIGQVLNPKVPQKGIRSTDYTGRYGGEEFLLVLPMTDLPNAQLAIERIRRILHDDPDNIHEVVAEGDIVAADGRILVSKGSKVSIEVTFGLLTLDQLSGVSTIGGRSLADLTRLSIGIADKLLYFGKQHGRNRVVTLDQVPGEFSIPDTALSIAYP